MAFWVLMLVLILMFVLFFLFIVKKKPIKKLLLGYVGVLVGYVLLVDFACGPNSHDVKIMKPQAKSIADYIVKNGVPKSLKDIPDLPYELLECEREVQYEAGHYEILKSKEGAEYAVIEEKCMFFNQKNSYDIKLWFVQHYQTISSTHGDIDAYNIISKTTVAYSFDFDKKSFLKIGKNNPHIYSSKSTGICKTFRQ